ncbi:hypothetical protein [Rosistilla oblonga]|uniref:hypothetical protein n=1 Tax=Rosistilla oblonga TaxID=2527990 RepID=UPI003A97851E
MTIPIIDSAESVNVSDEVIIHQNGERVLASIAQVRGSGGQEVRYEEYEGTTDGSGNVTINFDEDFQSAPIILPIPTRSGSRIIFPFVTSVAVGGLTLSALQSKGTLLLSSGPFETASSKDVKIVAIGV